jgi:hypothetical protein
MTCTTSTLTKQERSELSRLEGVIGQGFDSFRRVGEALARIAEGRLYRDEYSDFRTYLRDKWQLGKSQAYRLIAASEVAEEVSPAGDTTPAPGSERQCRALARLDDPELRQDAWERAVQAADGDQPTAAQVEAAVDQVEAEDLEALDLDVVASLSPDQQAEAFRAEEQRSKGREQRSQRQERRDDTRGRLERALQLLGKVRKLVAGVGPGVETALMMHDQYARELDCVREAA